MTTFEDLDDIKCNADLETMMIKQRWEEHGQRKKLKNLKSEKATQQTLKRRKLHQFQPIQEVSKLMDKAFLESELDDNVNEMDLSLYLALTVSKEELKKKGLTRVTHTRNSESHGAPPGITTAEVFAKQKRQGERGEEEAGKSLFHPSILHPSSPTQLQ